MASRQFSIAVLILSQVAVLSVWFSSAAVLSEMAGEVGLSAGQLAWLSTAVQVGFGTGALIYAAFGIADRFDPRAVFAISAALSAGCNLALLWVPVGGAEAMALRALTGAFLAGVYPVGMKIAVGWTMVNRALLVGALVGALTLGSASPHLIAWMGGADWRVTIWATSAIAAAGGLAMLTTGLGPYHARAPRLDFAAIAIAWTEPRIRYAILGYIGHMWELYAFWAWIGVIAATSFAMAGMADPAALAKLIAFLAIALGGIASVPAGLWGDRYGKARVALAAMVVSSLSALAAAFVFGGPVWLMIVILLVWGLSVVPDSGLFSSLVADAAPPERVGSIMTIQTAIGFLLTAFTVQVTPLLAEAIGWPPVLAIMAVGPVAGCFAMRRLMSGTDA
ncbi:MAG: MFS transporter [Pseudomonadota bacterium]